MDRERYCADLLTVIEREGVDVVLHGHEHAYGRTHQLAVDPGDCPRLIVNGFDAAFIDAACAAGYRILVHPAFARTREAPPGRAQVPFNDDGLEGSGLVEIACDS